MNKLLTPYKLGSIELQNRMVMAPMTRCRSSVEHIPGDLEAKYYAQRASAGLIITEGTSPSPNGLGYARIPGIYSEAQVDGWKKTTQAVHAKGGKIFVQFMHTGRISNALNMPKGARIIAPMAIKAAGEMYTDSKGMQPYPIPEEMTLTDIKNTILEYATAAELAIAAGFDGIELHAANGYLLEQFLNPKTNQRSDMYNGNASNRMKFVLEVAAASVKSIGGNRVGIRLSPYGAFNDVQPIYDGIDEFYGLLASELSTLGLAYLHVVDHSSMGAPEVPWKVKELLRKNFKGSFILSGGYNAQTAEKDLLEEKGDLVAFGRPFISNPDLPAKFAQNITLKNCDESTFYTPGEKGYTDY